MTPPNKLYTDFKEYYNTRKDLQHLDFYLVYQIYIAGYTKALNNLAHRFNTTSKNGKKE